jgi:hypothetical protein
MVSLEQAANITGLPQELVAALAVCQRIPSEQRLNGRVYVSRMALIGWCKLYGRILQHVASHTSSQEQVYFELVWMSRNGMLEGKERGSVRA